MLANRVLELRLNGGKNIVILHDNEPCHVHREAHRSSTDGGASAGPAPVERA